MAAEKEIAEGKHGIEHILKVYEDGTLLFPRYVLQDFERQIAAGYKSVSIQDIDGIPREYSLECPWARGFSAGSEGSKGSIDTTYPNAWRVHYASIQELTNLNPYTLESEVEVKSHPISIHYQNYNKVSDHTLEEVERTFRCSRRAWQKSGTRVSLERQLAATVFAPINKIVGFGLGPLSHYDDEGRVRSHWQHLAVATMAQALGKMGHGDIQCFVQDPAYKDVDKELLHSMNITVLNDPAGFLQINSQTLVVSVNPNIPVKQVTADVQWPAAMLWNTVKDQSKENSEWKKESWHRDGRIEESWISPYSTDPDSPRVRKMVKDYHNDEFQDIEGHFGNLTLYTIMQRELSPGQV